MQIFKHFCQNCSKYFQVLFLAVSSNIPKNLKIKFEKFLINFYCTFNFFHILLHIQKIFFIQSQAMLALLLSKDWNQFHLRKFYWSKAQAVYLTLECCCRCWRLLKINLIHLALGIMSVTISTESEMK